MRDGKEVGLAENRLKTGTGLALKLPAYASTGAGLSP
jgi:hypothetical protein